MSRREQAPAATEDAENDPILERLVRDRRSGEIESGMLTGSDDSDISATDRFEGDLSEDEALAVLGVHPQRAAQRRV